MKRLLIPGLLLAILLGLALRCPKLALRPMHNDEAVNAMKVGQLMNQGGYRYDPAEYHGPTLIYASRWLLALLQAPNFAAVTEGDLRAVAVIFGLGVILLIPLLKTELGAGPVIFSALLMAISPAFVFYSRYFIHEMLLVFFSFFTLASGWRYVATKKLGWAIAAGSGAGLMHATKETFLFSLVAMVIGMVLAMPKHFLPVTGRASWLNKKTLGHGLAALTAWAVVAVVLFSSFFSNWSGVTDSFKTYIPWLHRAGGASPHIHPWNFYFVRLLSYKSGRGPIWSEGFIFILALLGMVSAFQKKEAGSQRRFQRFLVFYTVILTLIYTLLSYKTPWCLLNFWLGFILLAGAGGCALLRWLPNLPAKIVIGILLFGGMAQLIGQTWRQNTIYYADARNPYVYAQTSPDLLNLVDRTDALMTAAPQTSVLQVAATDNDYWPLPWYFRKFKNVGWYDQSSFRDIKAEVMIVSPGLGKIPETNSNEIMTGIFALRPRVFLQMYVETNLWRNYLERPKPPGAGNAD